MGANWDLPYALEQTANVGPAGSPFDGHSALMAAGVLNHTCIMYAQRLKRGSVQSWKEEEEGD